MTLLLRCFKPENLWRQNAEKALCLRVPPNASLISYALTRVPGLSHGFRKDLDRMSGILAFESDGEMSLESSEHLDHFLGVWTKLAFDECQVERLSCTGEKVSEFLHFEK